VTTNDNNKVRAKDRCLVII